MNPRIRPHAPSEQLGVDTKSRQAVYRALFRNQMEPGLVDEIRAATNGGFVLGSERFQQEITAIVGRRTGRGSPGRPIK